MIRTEANLSLVSGLLVLVLSAAVIAVPSRSFAESRTACETTVDDTYRMKQFLASVIGKEEAVRRQRAETVLSAVDDRIRACPDSVSLHLLKVAALGTVARATGFSDSVTKRYGSRSKAALEGLLDVAPDHPWTMTLEGVWNFEVRRRGGGMGASMLGASTKRGRERLTEAFEAVGRDDPAVAYAYAIALLSYKPKKNADLAARLLRLSQDVAVANPTDITSEVLAEPISDLLALLESEDYDDASELAKNLL